MTDASAAAPAHRVRRRWLFAAVGAVAAVAALLPWLLTGGRMPLQNLWSEIPADIPFVLLPFHPYTATLTAALLLVGAAAAGIAGRGLGARWTRGGTLLLIGGVLLVQGAAVIQGALTTRATLPDRSDADLYMTALTVGTVLALLVGLGILALIAHAPRAGAIVGLAVGALAAGTWLAAVIVPFGSVPQEVPALLPLVQWVSPVLAGAAIAWAGIGSAGRLVAALSAVVIVWVGPAVLTGVGYALGSRVLWNDPAGMIDGAIQVFGLALLTPELAWRPIVACLLAAAIGLGIRALVARRRSRADSAAEEGLRHA